MKKLMMAAVVAAMVVPCEAAVDWTKTFAKNFGDAQKAAKAAEKPMYLHFTTTWCGWCRKIEQDVYSSDEGAKALEGYACATLDCTVPQGQQPKGEAKFNLDMMKRFNVSGYPSLVMVTADGAVLLTWSGYYPVKEFIAQLDKANKAFAEYKDFLKDIEKGDKASYDYQVKLLNGYTKYQKWDTAATAAAQVRKLDAKNEKGDAAAACYALYRAARAGDKGEAEVKALAADVVKFDPKNEKGMMQPVLWDMATAYLEAQKLKEAAGVLTDLTTKASKLSNEVQVWATLGQVQAQLGDFKPAQASIEKAVAANSDPRMAAGLKKLLDQIKAKAGDSK